MKRILSVFLIATLGGFASISINEFFIKDKKNFPELDQSSGLPAKYVNLSVVNAEKNLDFTHAAEMTVHSVVHVKTTYQNVSYNYDPFQYFFWGQPQQRQPHVQMSSGSGVIISGDGYIVTNNHVIDKAEKIEVTLNNKTTYEAHLVGSDKTTDLALLKIEEASTPFITYGNSDDVKVGEWALAVGNPFNLTSTVTAGIISAKGRSINIMENDPNRGIFPIESFIQTDAAVNPGNSGGALVNTRGELIGINTAIASNTGSYSGYSFAIPVNIVQKVMNDLLEFGEIQRAYIGVSIRDIDSKLAKEKELKEIRGVYVAGLNDGGAGQVAGLKDGDIITRIGEREVNTVPELQEQIGRYRPGDKVNVTLKRNGIEKIIPIVLKNKNGSTDIIRRDVAAKEEVFNIWEASFESVSEEEKQYLRIDGGAKAVKIKAGKLLNAGIKEGFIVTKIDRQAIRNPEDMINALKDKKGGILMEGIYPNGMRAYYGFGI